MADQQPSPTEIAPRADRVVARLSEQLATAYREIAMLEDVVQQQAAQLVVLQRDRAEAGQ